VSSIAPITSMTRATTLLVPFHQDELLAEGTISLPAGFLVERIEPVLAPGERWQRLLALYRAVAQAASVHTGVGVCPAVVSGDCLVALGTIAAVQRAGLDAALVWFDAHGDVHTRASSTSGYLGGMALRMAMGGDAELLARPLGLRPLGEERVALVGARDLDPAEVAYLAASRIHRLQVEDVRGDLHAPAPLIVHVDVDVIDPGELPGLSFAAPNGPRARAVLDAVRRLRDSGRVVAVDVACPWQPPASPRQSVDRASLLAELVAG
jgi:arginase